jgi:hypothetical protein
MGLAVLAKASRRSAWVGSISTNLEIKNELIHYSQDHPASKSDDERLDKLVQLILSVNRIYRNKKRRRKSNRGPRVV